MPLASPSDFRLPSFRPWQAARHATGSFSGFSPATSEAIS